MASSVIGALRVVLGLDAAQFDAGSKKAKGAVADLRSRFLALTGAVAAVGAGLAALSRNTVMAGTEISRLSQAANATPELFQKWAAASQTVGVEQDKLADILKDVNDRVGDFLQTGGGPMADFFENIAPKVGVTAEQFRHLSGPQALQLYVDSLRQAGVSQGEMTFYLEAMASDLTLLLPLLENGGAEMARLGDRAEAVGAVMSGETVEALRRTGLALSEMGQAVSAAANIIGAAFAPMLERAATAMVAAMQEGGALRVAVEALAANMDFLVNTAGVAVTALGARYVGAVISARLATFTLTGALRGLGAALLSLGFPALIIGAGALVTWFTRLMTSAGGFGEALALLRDVASEVWSRIGIGLQAAGSTITGVWQEIKAIGLEVFAGILTGGVEFGNRYIGIYRGAFEAVKAIWSALPAAIGDMAIGAANALIGGVESMLNAVSERINKFIGMVNDALALLPDWATGGEPIAIGAVGRIDLGGIENPFAGAARDAGAAAKEAFMQGFNQDTFTAPDTSAITGMADAARDSAETARLAARTLGTLATDPLKSWGALREVMGETATATDDAAAAAAALGQEIDALDGAGGGGGGGGSKGAKSKLDSVKDKVKEIATEASSAAQTIQGTFTDAFKGIVKEGQTLGQALGSVLQKLGDMALDSLGSWLFGGISKSLGGLFAGSIPGFANGTDSAPGGLAWVGERGPELVNLPRGSQVIPNHQLGGLNAAPPEAAVRLVGGDLILTDKGEIMTRVRLEQQQAVPGIVQQSVTATRESAKKFPIR